jgi:rRNA-processing protein CGR1
MAIQVASTPAAPLSAKTAQVTGQKKNGKNWHENKAAFRPNSGLTSYAKRAEKQKQEAEVKKMEKEMKEEKEQERQVRLIIIRVYAVLQFSNTFWQRKVQAIKDKRAAKEEKERYELLAAKMHAKRVDRLRRREKRNKMLKS